MTDRIPLRLTFDEGGNPSGLAEFQEGDRIAPAYVGISLGLLKREVTASGNITTSDIGKLLVCTNTDPITLTVQPNAIGEWSTTGLEPVIHIVQYGAGTVTIAAATDVLIECHEDDVMTLGGRISPAALMRVESDKWVLVGRLAAV